ncbi:MAG: DNA repair protein RadC [Candidatus Izemoplasmatales bacterium]
MDRIMEMPAAERPRERLERYGAENLGTHELVAILLRTGTKDHSAIDVAKEILFEAKGARGLREKTLPELASHAGMGKTKAGILLAALELGRRALESEPERPKVLGARDVFLIVKDDLAPLKQETMVALYLDARLALVEKRTIFVGGLNQSLVHPREVFKYAVKCSAFQVVLAHNHPSGDPTPSPQDLAVTKRFREAGELLGIRLADHVVVAGDRYVSIGEILKGEGMV